MIIDTMIYAMVSLTATPGMLGEALEAGHVSGERSVAISGMIDVRDLVTLRESDRKPAVLDLSEAQITDYTYSAPSYMGRSHFGAQALPPYIFFQAPYEEVILPAGLTSIDAGAFAASGVRRVVIPEGVTSIGDYAFYACSALESVVIPASVKHIGKGAFAACASLGEVDMTSSTLDALPDRCFAGSTSLVYLTVPTTVKSLGREVFADTSITELRLASVTSLAPYALADMPMLESVTLNEGAKYDEGTLMNNPRLRMINGAPAQLPALFAANCYTLEPSDLLPATAGVGRYAFSNSMVSELILAPSVNYIDEGAFKGLTSLTSVEARGLGDNIPEAHEGAFAGLETGNILLMVDEESRGTWASHPVWGRFDVQSDLTVSVERVEEASADDIEIRMVGGMLSVRANAPIDTGAIFSVDGRHVAAIPAGETTAEVSLERLSDKVLLVVVNAGTARRTVKIAL